MASKHKQEDPWAGFVDVLSNILMVVIFLVVILGVAIFALSQQITKVAVENAVKAERESQQRQGEQPKAADVVAEASSQKPPSVPEENRGAAGSFEAAKALRARESDDIAGNTNLTVRSAPTPASTEIEVASESAGRVKGRLSSSSPKPS